MKFLILVLVMIAACKSTAPDPATNQKTEDVSQSEPDIAQQPDTQTVECGETTVVTLETSDSIELKADYHPPAKAGAGAVVLFHMIPPNFDRSSYPERVRKAFTDKGLAVLNVDRRGAGESQGEPKAAYEGDGGRLDVEAAVKFVTSSDRACAAGEIMLVGASNGTTSVFDYVTQRDESLPAPKSIAWLSPGSYTENQNKISDHEELMKALPVLIVHPASEPWADSYADFSEMWRVLKLENGQHGTRNFDEGDLENAQLDALVEWATTSLN